MVAQNPHEPAIAPPLEKKREWRISGFSRVKLAYRFNAKMYILFTKTICSNLATNPVSGKKTRLRIQTCRYMVRYPSTHYRVYLNSPFACHRFIISDSFRVFCLFLLRQYLHFIFQITGTQRHRHSILERLKKLKNKEKKQRETVLFLKTNRVRDQPAKHGERSSG